MSYKTRGFENFTIMGTVAESDMERLAQNDAAERFDEDSMRITLLGAKVVIPGALDGRRSHDHITMYTHPDPELRSRLVVTDAQGTDGWLTEYRNDEVISDSTTIYHGPNIEPEVLEFPLEDHTVEYRAKAIGRVGLYFAPGNYTVLEGRPFEITQRTDTASKQYYLMTAPPLHPREG